MTLHHETPAHDASAHIEWMMQALSEATQALDDGEAPIGCVLIDGDGVVIGRGHNTMRDSGIVTAHAEMNAFAAAGDRIAPGTTVTMLSTLEPCVMCTGAAMQAGVNTIIFGLRAPADSGTGRVHPPQSPNTTAPEIIGDVGADESRALFYRWLEKHAGDGSRDEQRQFIEQLLALTQEGELPKPIEGAEPHEHA
ncbi:MAG: nucleoside deaminase [Gemmatimonadota bacterium]